MWNRRRVGIFIATWAALFATQAPAAEIFGAKFTHQLTPPEFCTTKKGVMCSW